MTLKVSYSCYVIVLLFPYTSFCNKNINMIEIFWYYRVLSSVESFDPLTEMWVAAAPLEVGPKSVAATKFQDLISEAGVVRAAQSNSLCRNVDCYDAEHNV
jgi:hypothetical protein